MEQFNWDECAKARSLVTFEYLKKVHNTSISEEDFAAQYSALPRTGKLHASNVRKPSMARHQYRHLKTKFGFFA